MTVTLTINNPYYEQRIEEMARISGMDAATLCSAMITKKVQDYELLLSEYKYEIVTDWIPNGREDEP